MKSTQETFLDSKVTVTHVYQWRKIGTPHWRSDPLDTDLDTPIILNLPEFLLSCEKWEPDCEHRVVKVSQQTARTVIKNVKKDVDAGPCCRVV